MKNNYKTLSLIHERDKDYEVFQEVVNLFIWTFQGATTPKIMEYSPRKYMNDIVVCISGDDIVGGLLREACEDTGFTTIEFIATRPDDKRRGIGTRLMRHVEAQARREGRTGIRLIPKEDVGALAFYFKNDYEVSNNSSNIVYLQKIFP